jgi:eukaryotic-like serine/threonine-protein kinase
MQPTADCLDPETLAAYLDGALTEAAAAHADRHVDHCESCRGELSALAATHSFPAGSGGALLVEGTLLEGKLGRYEVLRELGRGSMGIVVRAYDPELERAVAVKILSGLDGTEARDRLRREAQAMARLSHPNVATVYDVATHGDLLFIAMELIEGTTLRERVRSPRPWRATLAECLAAGRGLAAAHAARLVHRDYKPENVLLGADGRVVVSDFGLAVIDTRGDDRDDRHPRATRTPHATTLAGTPAYMAPELLRGESATPASDQFSFCVATYEALYGERPFPGDTLAELRERTAGVPRDPPPGSRVPARIRAVLLRGLASDPARRFPSMTALLAALERRPRWPLAAAIVAAGTITLGVAVSRSAAGCPIEELAWDRAALVHALGERPGALARITVALDAYEASWRAARAVACEHARTTTRACLERGRQEAIELVGALARDPGLAERGVEAVYRLRDPAACGSGGGEVDPRLARAAARLAAGDLGETLAITSAVLAGTSDATTRAEALLIRGRAEMLEGRLDASEATLREALVTAERAHADPLVAAIWVELVQTTGAQKHRFEAAATHMLAAEAAFQRIDRDGGDVGPALRARYAYVAGTTLLANGKLDEARAQLERALVAASDERPGDRGLVHAALCDVDRQQRRLEAAREHCRTALALLGRAFGPDHHRLAPTFNVLGALELDANQLAPARVHFARAIAVFEHGGLEHERGLALALSNTAATWMRTGDPDRAQPLFERASRLFATHHPDHPQRVIPLQGLASVALERGDHRAAIARYEEALAVTDRAYGKPSEARLPILFNLALAHVRLGELDRAAVLADELIAQASIPGREAWAMQGHALDLAASLAEQRGDHVASVALLERALVALDHDDRPRQRAWIDGQLGGALRRIGQPERAIAPLERALAYYATDPSDPYVAALARFQLARALWDTGRDRPRARTLARIAGDELAATKAGHNLVPLRAEVARWLAKHR